MNRCASTFAALGLSVALLSCNDGSVVSPTESGPDIDAAAPADVILDANQIGFLPEGVDAIPGFFFLSPLGDQPSTIDTFDPSLENRLRMAVCRIPGDANDPPPTDASAYDAFASCVDFDDPLPPDAGPTADDIPSNCGGQTDCRFINYNGNGDGFALDLAGEFYERKFQERRISINTFHRLFVLLDELDENGDFIRDPDGNPVYNVLGYVDVFPTDPEEVPSTTFPGVHVYRWGSNVPVKVRVELDAVCSLRFGVADCDQEIIDCAEGGDVLTENAQVIFRAGACDQDETLVTLQELENDFRPECFADPDGSTPLALPQLGTCITVDTDLPDSEFPLNVPAVICLDPEVVFPVNDEIWQIHRAERDPLTGEIVQISALQAIADLECNPDIFVAALPDHPALRYAALGLRHLGRLLGPQPLSAGDRLASETSFFSDFTWAGLAAPVAVTPQDDIVIDADGDDSETVTVTAAAVDFEDPPAGVPDVVFDVAPVLAGDVVQNPATGESTSDPAMPIEVVSDGNGEATVQVTYKGVAVGPVHGVVFSGVGLQDAADFDQENHETGVLDVPERSLTFTATLVGSAAVVDDGDFTQGQDVEVDAVVAEPLPITVGDGAEGGLGNLLEGQTVVWTVDGGSLVESDGACTDDDFTAGGTPTLELVTDDQGAASACWKLGTAAGTFTATATVVDADGNPILDGDGNPVQQTYVVNAVASSAAQLAFVTPFDGQPVADFGAVGPAETVLLEAEVQDEFDNPRLGGGDAVSWTVVEADGGSLFEFDAATDACTTTALTSGTSITDADAVARACWTLPLVDAPSPFEANASAAFTGDVLSYLARPTCSERQGVGTATIGGGLGTDWVCARESGPWAVKLSGGETEARILWMNDDDNLYLAVEVLSTDLTDVRVDFNDNDNGFVGPDGEALLDGNEDGLRYDPDGGTFEDEHLTENCLNKSQADCPAPDDTQDGSAGHAVVDGTVVYEFAHPLASGQAEDFDLVSGEWIGSFFTLIGGGGAKGNSQIEDFRVFRCFQIADPAGVMVTADGWIPCGDPAVDPTVGG